MFRPLDILSIFSRKLRPTVSAASVSATGLVRRENQDAAFADPSHGFYCVADGMGGGQGGALASQWTCDALHSICTTSFNKLHPSERTARLGEALQSVNSRILSHARSNKLKMMGTTVAFMLTDVHHPKSAILCHVGDTRIYRWRLGSLELLTLDHTVGGEIGRAISDSSETQSAILQSRRNPLSHVLTRAVGTELRVRPDWRRVDLKPGDRFLICSDGVHDMLSDVSIQNVIESSSSPQAAIDALSSSVLYAGASDNFSAIVLFI